MGKVKKVNLIIILVAATALLSFQQVFAAQVWITDVPGYGYNSGSSPFAGCGPTSGVMILDTYDNRLAGADGSPGDLVSDPFNVTWDLHNNYMGTNAAGFGSTEDFHHGIEDYASDHGYSLEATVHVEPTTYNAANWTAYDATEVALDANFWNTSSWDILDGAFIDFIDDEIDAGHPFVATVDSDADGAGDHWMVGVGYDLALMQWAGYSTYDSSLHWYDIESAFIKGNTMGIGYVRTFDFGGYIGGSVPEPSTLLLMGIGLLGLVGYNRKRSGKKS